MTLKPFLRTAIAVLSLASLPAAAETVAIAGSTTVAGRLLARNIGPLKAATGIDLDVQPVGSGRGMLALFEGGVSVAAISESLSAAIEAGQRAAAAQNKTVSVPGNLVVHTISTDGILAIVNEENPVQALSRSQLRDLFTGKITNWKEVGGPDLPVKVVTSVAGSGTRGAFQEDLMGGANFADGTIEVKSDSDQPDAVSKDKGAIGQASPIVWVANPGKTKIVRAPTVDRPLALVTVGAPKPEVQRVIDFLRAGESGKRLSQKKSGFFSSFFQ